MREYSILYYTSVILSLLLVLLGLNSYSPVTLCCLIYGALQVDQSDPTLEAVRNLGIACKQTLQIRPRNIYSIKITS